MPSEAPNLTTAGERNGAGEGQLSPLEGSWRVDPERSRVGFRVKKMGVYHVKGRFRELEGKIEVHQGAARGEVTIQASSITTRMPPRDLHLRSGDFLDVDTYPLIRVTSSSIETDTEGGLRVPASFELHGVSKTVELAGHRHDGADPVVLHLTGALDRHDFGIRPRQPFEMVVGSEILLDVELALKRA